MKTHSLRILSLEPPSHALFARIITTMLCACWSLGADAGTATKNLIVYGPVPGLSGLSVIALAFLAGTRTVAVVFAGMVTLSSVPWDN
jgi:hypothetical protein